MLVGISANVFAQSTGTNPSPGATHSYSVTDNATSSYAWSVTRGDLTTAAGADASLSSTTGNAINITWASGLTVGDWYYVHVVETQAGCTNEKVLPVQITASNFFLALAADNATSCYDGPVSVSLNVNDPEYDHGDVTLTYTITPSGVNTSSGGYSFNFDLATNLPAGYTTVAPTVSAGNASVAGSTVTVTDENAVTLQFVVTNGNTYTNVTDATGTAADFTATVGISNGVTGNGVSDNGSGTYSGGTDVSRPHTTTITTN